MTWEKPSYVEITMSAEIGGYQEDNSEERIPVAVDRLDHPKLRDENE
jgi:hypothetical protein